MTENLINLGYWGSLITQIRATLSISQESFAAAICTNQATISRWEKGHVIPSYDKQKNRAFRNGAWCGFIRRLGRSNKK